MPIDEARVGALVAIAHRAGNDLLLATQAAELGADVIEADVHLYRGRTEVRHLKTISRLPILWDRWKLAPGWTARLTLPELCDELGSCPGPAVMLDLKGHDARLPDRVIEAIVSLRTHRDVWVCSQDWDLVDRFLDVDRICVLHSIGNRGQLSRFTRRAAHRGDGISIHRKLLTKRVVETLRETSPFITTWPINDDASLSYAIEYGVDGITTDNPSLLARISAARARSRQA